MNAIALTESGAMKRELTSHKVNGLNDKLGIVVLDEPGAGGANHRYCIFRGYDTVNQELNANPTCYIDFQKGPIGEVGINGISNEALLAIVEDRLAGFQSGPFACGSNQMALIHVQSAMDVLHARTKERVARGVEGTNQQ